MRFFLVITLFIVGCGSEIETSFCPGLTNCTASSASSSSSTTLSSFFFDDFNRADAGIATSANWNLFGSGATVDIDTNQIKTDSQGGNAALAFYTTLIPQDDVKVSLDVSITAVAFPTTNNANILVLLRNADNNQAQDTYACGITEISLGTKQLTMFKVVSGATTTLASSAGTVPLTNGHSYSISFQAVGTALSCTITGSASFTITATDTSFSSGYTGFGGDNVGAEGGSKFDNFKVELVN